MARPTLYARLANYIDYAVGHSTAPYNSADHDLEHNALVTSVNQAIAVLNGITRDDGALLNGSVTVDTISASLYAFLTAIRQPSQYAGAWVTNKAFVFADVVTDGITTYFCIVPHTSTVLATDVAASKWIAIGIRLGGAFGAASLDASGLIPLAQIPPAIPYSKLSGLIPLAQIPPAIPYSKLTRFTYQTTVDFGATPINAQTFRVAAVGVKTTDFIIASATSKVGDTIGDELEMDGLDVSANCYANDVLTINASAFGFVAGQYVITYSIL